MKKLHYVMPMAGRGSRFDNKDYNFPKPLMIIYGKPFFYWATQSIRKFIPLASLDVVVLKEHIEKFSIDRKILDLFPEAKIHVLTEVTDGAVITCIKGIESIHDDLPLLFNDCDHLFKSSSFNNFCINGFPGNIDGVLLTFESDDPKFSYIGKDEVGNITRTIEKVVISNEAICGCYYFRDKDTFIDSAEKYLKRCSYSEYFMSGVYNVMLEEKNILKSMATDFHVSFGTPDEYKEAKESREYEELI